MYWFWFFFFGTQPAFLLLGMTGMLGKEAKRAADDLAQGLGILLLVVVVLAIVGYLGYLILKGIGVVQ